MTILPSEAEFPDNVIGVVAARIQPAIDADLTVVKRPLRTTDSTQSVGLFASTGLPDRTSVEIRSVQPTLRTYNIIMQTLVQDTDEEACIKVHSILTQRLWRMFYRDAPLNTGLTALAVNVNNVVERLQRRGITLQRYLGNEIQGTFIRTSWTECWVETETVEI